MDANKLFRDTRGMLNMIKNDEDKLREALTFLEDQQLSKHHTDPLVEVPEDCRATVHQIADALENGFVCFLNPETLEIEQLEQNTYYPNEDYEELNEDRMDEFDLNYKTWDNMIRFEPLNVNEIYLIMEKYVAQREDGELTRRLEDSLSNEKPLNSFRKIIDECGFTLKEDWQDYKKCAIIEYVTAKLLNELRSKRYESSETAF